MTCWISKLFEQLIETLNETYEIVNYDATMHVITIFEQINLNKSLFRNSDAVKYMKKLRILTPDKYLSFRLDLLLRKWQKANRTWEQRQRPMSQSVFEAITTNDEQYFNICSIELLMERLEHAVDQNFKVLDMSTALNAIMTLEELRIDEPNLIKPKMIDYLRRVRCQTTNGYLAEQLELLETKWEAIRKM